MLSHVCLRDLGLLGFLLPGPRLVLRCGLFVDLLLMLQHHVVVVLSCSGFQPLE